MTVELSHFYSWQKSPDELLENLFAEFAVNNGKNLVITAKWSERILNEPEFFDVLMAKASRFGLKFTDSHAPYGYSWDLNCPDRERRPELLKGQMTVLQAAAVAGVKVVTMHIGRHHDGHTLPELRELTVDSLANLLPEAERLGVIIAIENTLHPADTPDEVLFYLDYLKNTNLGCCFDSGHANMFDGCEKVILQLQPHIVTAHLHDNHGERDEHAMFGDGTINWPETIALLKRSPRLATVQNEVNSCGHCIPFGRVVPAFNYLWENERLAK